MRIRSGQTILFQGDIITDADRNRWEPHNLGTGCVIMVAQRFSKEHPEVNVTFLNRGISGNRIRDLRERWQEDCLDLKPDIVSIMIGVNDTLGTFLWGEPTSIEDFGKGLRRHSGSEPEKSGCADSLDGAIHSPLV